MARVKLMPITGKDTDVFQGTGILFLGTANALEYNDNEMGFAGGIVADVKLKYTLETTDVSGGSLEMDLFTIPKKEVMTLEVQFRELGDFTRLRKKWGIGTVGSVTGDDVEVTGESVELISNFFMALQNSGIKSSPAISVYSTDATPTIYTESTDGSDNDYVLDADNGNLRRTANSSIPDGATVLVDYTFTELDKETFTIGSVGQIDVYPLKFIAPNWDSNRITLKLWRVQPKMNGDLTFSNNNPTYPTITFTALAARYKNADECLYYMDKEKITA